MKVSLETTLGSFLWVSGVSVRLENCLRNGCLDRTRGKIVKFQTVGDIVQFSAIELLNGMDNFGRKSLKELELVLAENNIFLKGVKDKEEKRQELEIARITCCANCDHAVTLRDGEDIYLCRRFPPQFVPLVGWVSPEVVASFRCGEFSRRNTL